MSYSEFTLPAAIQTFGLTASTGVDLFADARPVAVSPTTRAVLDQNEPLAALINTEKAWSELVVALLLAEVWQQSGRRISLFSGVEFNVDPAAKLNGVCDFLLGRGPQLPYVTDPVVVVVEAKKEDIPGGYGQCVAAMVAAQRFNRTAGNPDGDVYGCVTTGANWRFLRLRGDQLAIDLPLYQIADPDRLLGVFLHLVAPPPSPG